MAKVMEDLRKPTEEIKGYYMKGLECAQGSGSKKAEVCYDTDYYYLNVFDLTKINQIFMASTSMILSLHLICINFFRY